MLLNSARNKHALIQRLVDLEDEACRFEVIARNPPTDPTQEWSLIQRACLDRMHRLRREIVVAAETLGLQIAA